MLAGLRTNENVSGCQLCSLVTILIFMGEAQAP